MEGVVHEGLLETVKCGRFCGERKMGGTLYRKGFSVDGIGPGTVRAQ